MSSRLKRIPRACSAIATKNNRGAQKTRRGNPVKKMRAADFSWEAPPSPVKTTISSAAIVAYRLRNKRGSVPPKEPTACFINLREDASPKASTHRSFQSLTRFTLIYPSCSVPLFGNGRAINSAEASLPIHSPFLLGFSIAGR
ncbi:MAG TPA: hypothetical protein VFZ22_05700 [Pyrinomonadaceae bacterium]|nr:hypothetical protein [Pyrinomonadaceae bacterium]